MPKEAVFTLKLESELRDAFVAAAAAMDRPASQLVREFMRKFVSDRQQERDHDAWFRAEVQRALDQPGPRIAHEEVIRETDEIIERVAARKKSP